MIEKKIVEALDPVFDAIIAVEKKLDQLVLTPGPQGEPGRDGADADEGRIVERMKADQAFLDRLKGEQGEPGERGEPGEPGRDADPDQVGRAILGDVVSQVKENLDETPWTAGIYREGKCVSHFIGRTYQAVCDTVDEPGDSPNWKRIGTHGLRDTGGFSGDRSYEPGDLYHKDGATFLFDGASHRLFVPKGVTPKELEKAIKGVRSSQADAIADLAAKNAALEARIDALTDALTTYKAVIERLSADIDVVTGRL